MTSNRSRNERHLVLLLAFLAVLLTSDGICALHEQIKKQPSNKIISNFSSLLTKMGLKTEQTLFSAASQGVNLPFVGKTDAITFNLDDLALQKHFRLLSKSAAITCSPDGTIPYVVNILPRSESAIIPFPDVASQEAQMKQGFQSIVGLPKNPPVISFDTALKTAFEAELSKQIIAYYVILSSSLFDKPKAVWIIHAWGIPPSMPPRPPGSNFRLPSENARNHMRSVIDATTGNFYFADTIPQPF